MNAILRLINCKLLLYRDILNSPIFNLLPIAGIQRFRMQEYLETNMRPVDNDTSSEELFPGGLRAVPHRICNLSLQWLPVLHRRGEEMKRHQQDNRHPGWGRYADRPVEKKWICTKEV